MSSKIEKKLPFLFVFLLLMTACETKTTTTDSCGDAFLDPGEECDGDVGENTCASLGHYKLLGTLTCKANCEFDRTDCGGRCGDGETDAADGEQCDGAHLNSNSCASLGFGGGVLACQEDCQYDVSGCTTACGNGYVEGEEPCDDGNLRDGDGCSPLCAVEEGWECTRQGTSLCSPLCGDDGLVGEEICDGPALDGRTCETLGFYGGTLSCTDLCALDTSSCEAQGRCGDGIRQDLHGEVCDGPDLGGETCVSQGFHGGELACSSDCLSTDISDCMAQGECGDGVVQGGYGEECDLVNFVGLTCEALGYNGGSLACTMDCHLDPTNCMETGQCGDHLLQSAYEECDGDLLDGQSCLTNGFYSGTLACAGDCRFDLSGCEQRCGDGAVQPLFGEECDGANLDGQTCESQGYRPGALLCDTACAFDFSGCEGRCGDAVIQSTYGEQCDGPSLDGQTCRSRGHFTGTLQCDADCAFLETGCPEIVQLTTGAMHTCARLSDGTARCWGYNQVGQLGSGDLVNRTSPIPVPALGTIVSIQAGYYHTCAILADASVSCWGQNDLNQLGNGTYVNSSLPVLVQGLGSPATSLAVGYHHNCVVHAGGTASCWGNNNKGQLGDGTTLSRNTPVVVSGLVLAAELTAGNEHTCARLTDGTAVCWGENEYSQLGDGTSNDRLTPVAVSGLSGAAAIDAGGFHTCARLTDGTAVCWGRNLYGQLGDGTTFSRNTPTPVIGLTGVVGLSAGDLHTCALTTGGNAYCWGRNQYSQLGDGTTTDQLRPTAVLNLLQGQSIAAGSRHSCVTKDDGRQAWCWGYNYGGQLGDGSFTTRAAPVQVLP
jgi:cysteine-rich repeat protein